MKKLLVFLYCLQLQQLYGQADLNDSGSRISFNENWKFFFGEVPPVNDYSYNDSAWRSLQLPHDWSIEGRFDKNSPATVGGEGLTGGLGWYRKSFLINNKDRNKNILIDFDGIYRNSEVWINGQYLGRRPNGYISFRYDLPPFLHYGTQKNVIAVKVENSQQPNSRWYSGSGIYRNVWLGSTGKTYINHWGTYITTSSISEKLAAVHIEIHHRQPDKQTIRIKNYIFDAENQQVAVDPAEWKSGLDTRLKLQTNLTVSNPRLWFVDRPYLYRAVTDMRINGSSMDKNTRPFGIRYFSFDVQDGFSLNGKSMKINDVCDHHDLGCLGSAVNVVLRQCVVGMGIYP